MLNDHQIAWLNDNIDHWLGRARTRRDAAEDLRREGHIKEADHCLQVASEYEHRAAQIAKGAA